MQRNWIVILLTAVVAAAIGFCVAVFSPMLNGGQAERQVVQLQDELRRADERMEELQGYAEEMSRQVEAMAQDRTAQESANASQVAQLQEMLAQREAQLAQSQAEAEAANDMLQADLDAARAEQERLSAELREAEAVRDALLDSLDVATGAINDGGAGGSSGGVDVEPIIVVEPEEDELFDVQRIFFGTDRAVEDNTDTGPVFGHDRAGKLTVGYTDITIPKTAHEIGQIELPESFTLFKITLWEQNEDPKRHFTVYETAELTQDDFLAMSAEAANGATAYPGTAFVFIHGFNTPFRAASFRAAQLAYDLGFDGPAFLYSWPSVGSTLDYVADMDSAANAAPQMDEFLDLVFRVPGVERVEILAHSMGNAALAELLKRAGTRMAARNDKPVDQMVLAAPDLDADQFRSIVDRFTRVANGVTIYAASTDLALLASKSIRRNYERLGDVGDDGPVVVPGVDSIDVSAVGTEVLSLNHNIYARNRGILDDLGRLWRSGERPPPVRMPTLKTIDTQAGPYWQMPQ